MNRQLARLGLLVALVAAVGGIRTDALAGASGGPRSAAYNLDPGKEVYFNIAFDANKPASVFAVSDDASADIDMFIYDSNGVLVGKDVLPDASPLVIWTPTVNQIYKVVVRNVSKQISVFTITTN